MPKISLWFILGMYVGAVFFYLGQEVEKDVF